MIDQYWVMKCEQERLQEEAEEHLKAIDREQNQFPIPCCEKGEAQEDSSSCFSLLKRYAECQESLSDLECATRLLNWQQLMALQDPKEEEERRNFLIDAAQWFNERSKFESRSKEWMQILRKHHADQHKQRMKKRLADKLTKN